MIQSDTASESTLSQQAQLRRDELVELRSEINSAKLSRQNGKIPTSFGTRCIIRMQQLAAIHNHTPTFATDVSGFRILFEQVATRLDFYGGRGLLVLLRQNQIVKTKNQFSVHDFPYHF